MFKNYLFVRSEQTINAFGKFTGELLKMEGFASFEIIDLDKDLFPKLDSNDTVVVTRCFLRQNEINELLDAVKVGAGLVLIQPRTKFVLALGISPLHKVEYPCRLLTAADKIQVHTPVQLHKVPDEWDVINSIDNENQDPVIIHSTLGLGAVSLFFYDISATVARLRFGDPVLASYTTVGFSWEHFFDMAAEQIDEDAISLPQADLHSQLLASEVQRVAPQFIPQLWYFEKISHNTAIAFHSDGDHSTPEEFEELATALEEYDAHAVFYLMMNYTHNMSSAKAQELRERGHAFAPHIFVPPVADHNSDEAYFTYPEALVEQSESFEEFYGKKGSTLQAHCAPWIEYLEWVEVHEKQGFRLLFAPMGFSKNNRKSWGQYLFGSGRPIKFFDGKKGIRDVWQQPTIFFDDGTLLEMFADEEFMRKRIDKTLSNAMNKFFSSFGMLSHPCAFSQYSHKMMKYIFAWMHEWQQPIYSGEEWLEYSDRRAAISIKQNGNTIEINNLNGKQALMLPKAAKHISVNGKTIDGVLKELGSKCCTFIQLDSQQHDNNLTVEYSCKE